ncbi:MAG: hypothetical protein GX277_05810, partial [Bacteroidales bacterium]|nr:hypothetical protein [Bacteroidales bacterium]
DPNSISLTSSYIFVGNASNQAEGVAMQGDASIASDGTLTIANNAITSAKISDNSISTAKIIDKNITLAKIQDINTNTFIGRSAAGTGTAEQLSIATVKSMLDISNTNSGDVSLSGQNYLSLSGQTITANAINLGNTNVTGTLPIANGGTGATTAQAAINALAGDVTSGYYLRGNGTNITLSPIVATDVPILNQNTTGNAATATTATTATNIAGGSAGTILYQTAANTTGFLPTGAAGQVLKSNGAAAPSWGDAATYSAGNGLSLTSTTFALKNSTNLDLNNVPRWDNANNQFTNSSIWDNNAGNVHIGGNTISTSYALQVTGAFKTEKIYHSSDARWKTDILQIESALSKVQQLRGVTYSWKADEFPEHNFSKGTQIGLIAQEVETVFPELVITDESGYKAVEYANLVAVLIEAIKEQQTIIDAQKVQLAQLQTQNNSMQTELSQLQTMQEQITRLESQITHMNSVLLLLQPTVQY